MEPRQIVARAEALKKKSHRLSLDLRLKSVSDARKFLKEHGLVLWDARAELPNLLDAMLGRVANERERKEGRPSETCLQWRNELLSDSDLLECCFFRKYSTALHQDLWPAATLFAKKNRKLAEEGGIVSREATRIVRHLAREGASETGELRKALRFDTPALSRLFQHAKRELQDRLIVLSFAEANSKGKGGKETLTFWSSRMPKQVVARADQISESDARLKLLAATLDSCVISDEKNLRKWFVWEARDPREWVDELVAKKTIVRVRHQKQSWLISSKLLRN